MPLAVRMRSPCSRSSAGGNDAITVYQVGDPTPVEVYEEVGCAEDPNPGPDGGRVRDIRILWLDHRRALMNVVLKRAFGNRTHNDRQQAMLLM